MVRFSLGIFQKPSLRSCKAFAPAQSSKLVAPALRPYGGFWKMPDGSSAIKKALRFIGELCDPAGTRTQGPYIKSVLLYQLSYGIGWMANIRLLPC